MKENIETKDVQRTEYLDKNGLDMLWAKVKENTHNQVEVERKRATTQEDKIIETKADKSELHTSYVSNSTFTALQKKVAANTAAISGKQDAGRYIPYERRGLNDDFCYIIPPNYYIECRTNKFDNGKYNYTHMSSQTISLNNAGGFSATIDSEGINISGGSNDYTTHNLQLSTSMIRSRDNSSGHSLEFQLSRDGLKLADGRDYKVLTSNGSTIDITKYALNKTATKDNFGIVKVGGGLSVTDGVISVDSKLFALDMVSYGVEWDTTVADPACTRIGNPLLHKQLPIQSEYKGCLVKNGKVNYYLDPNDWSKKADGTPSVLDGTDGDVMVHIPKFYGKSGSNVNKRWVRISTTQVDSSWVEIPEMFVSAYRITTFDDSGTPKIASVVNTTANYRGGSNRVYYDQHLDTDKFKTDLGKPRTNVSREKMRTMATNSGQELLCYEFYKWIFYWAYVIEYANFNSQKEFNSELTSDGYHQGGLGSGLTTLNYQKWGSYNGRNPITPCGYTNEFGNFSGEKTTSLKLDSEQTGTAIHINRWRGFENPFGDIYTNLDGIVLERDAPSSDSNVYTTSDSSKFGDDTSVMTIVGSEPNLNGTIMEFDLGETGEIIPQYMVNSALKYKCDYHICDISAGKKTLKVGGCASNGNYAGLCNLDTTDTANDISSFVGFRSVIRA